MTDETVERPLEITPAEPEMTQPVIIDLGRQKSKDIKDLKNGKGRLWDDMLKVVEEVKDMLGDEAGSAIIVPVAMVYQKKAKRQRLSKYLFPNIK